MRKTIIALGLGLSLSLSALEIGDTAPRIELKGLDASGAAVETDIRETQNPLQRYIILEFMATFCIKSTLHMPNVKRLVDAMGDYGTFRQISADRNPKLYQEFLENQKFDIEFPVAFDTMRTATSFYGVRALSTFYVLEKTEDDYVVIDTHEGFLTEAMVDEWADKVTQGLPPIHPSSPVHCTVKATVESVPPPLVEFPLTGDTIEIDLSSTTLHMEDLVFFGSGGDERGLFFRQTLIKQNQSDRIVYSGVNEASEVLIEFWPQKANSKIARAYITQSFSGADANFVFLQCE